MSLVLTFLVFQIISHLALATEESPEVTTCSGVIRGHYKTSYGNRSFEAYEGIPYAQPPIGDLRFEAPQPIQPWSDTLVANQSATVCLQWNHLSLHPADRLEGVEDCLYMNVYAPLRKNTSEAVLHPVIFFIHGGAFQYGSGSTYGSKYLMDREVIYVTFNYRLGPLGFLSTEDDVVPGNMGLKDQSVALRWVSENIEAFGGDPNRITLSGQSAGGASVHLHYMSPWSAGLFQGGMSFSGNALEAWTQAENSLEKAKKLASIVGCTSEDTTGMIQCLKSSPGEPIVRAVADFMPWLYNPISPFGPVVEQGGDNPFISQKPIDIIHSGQMQNLPWITGGTSEEGLYPAADFIANATLLEQLNDNWEEYAPHLLEFNYTISSDEKAEVARTIKKHYVGENDFDNSTVPQIIRMISDRLFDYNVERAARLHAKVNTKPTWGYVFSYRGAHSLSEFMSGTTNRYGVSHGDDILYVLDAIFDPTTTESDRAIQQKMIDLWTTFATNGIPDLEVTWPRLNASKKKFSFLRISDAENIKMDTNGNFGNKNFWEKIDFQENIPTTR